MLEPFPKADSTPSFSTGNQKLTIHPPATPSHSMESDPAASTDLKHRNSDLFEVNQADNSPIHKEGISEFDNGKQRVELREKKEDHCPVDTTSNSLGLRPVFLSPSSPFPHITHSLFNSPPLEPHVLLCDEAGTLSSPQNATPGKILQLRDIQPRRRTNLPSPKLQKRQI